MRYDLRTLLIVMALGPAAAIAATICGCNRDSDGAPKASRTAYEVMCLSLLCERLDEEGFDFESVEDLRQLRQAAKARTTYGKSDFDGDYLLKTPYGNEYQFRFSKDE